MAAVSNLRLGCVDGPSSWPLLLLHKADVALPLWRRGLTYWTVTRKYQAFKAEALPSQGEPLDPLMGVGGLPGRVSSTVPPGSQSPYSLQLFAFSQRQAVGWWGRRSKLSSQSAPVFGFWRSVWPACYQLDSHPPPARPPPKLRR